MRIVCIHKERKPHRIHYAWAKSVTNEFYKLAPDSLYGDLHLKVRNGILQQIIAFFTSARIPKADIYLVEGMSAMLLAILRKKKDSKIILINSDTFFYNYARAGPLTRLIYGKYLKHVDYMISTSYMLKEMAKPYTKVPHEVVYPFVEKKFLKAHADIDSKNICYFGRLTPEKNVNIIIDVFNKVMPENKDKLILVGGKINNKQKNIIVKPWTKDIISDIKNCGLFIMLSRYDSFGVSIAEAMGLGMPAIISEFCGAKEIVSKVSKELVVDLDVDKIANLIDKINSNSRLKHELSRKSRAAAGKLTEEKSIIDFKKAFYKLVGGRKAR